MAAFLLIKVSVVILQFTIATPITERSPPPHTAPPNIDTTTITHVIDPETSPPASSEQESTTLHPEIIPTSRGPANTPFRHSQKSTRSISTKPTRHSDRPHPTHPTTTPKPPPTKPPHPPPILDQCTNLPLISYADVMSSGINLVSGNIKGRIFNNHGHSCPCRKVIDTETGTLYRLPCNLDNVLFPVQADGELQVNSYMSNYDYAKAVTEGSGNSASVGVGPINIGPIGFDIGSTWSHSETYKTAFKEMKNKKSVLFQVETELSLAEFIYKNNQFNFSTHFQKALGALPEKSLHDTHQAYVDFFQQFGTHYAHSGSLGGRYAYIYVFNQDTLSTMNLNMETTKNCLKVSAQIHLFGIKIGGSDTSCKTTTSSTVTTKSVANAATTKLVDVTGGTAETAGRLAADAVFPISNGTLISNYQSWLLGVQRNPKILKKSLVSVCELILGEKNGGQKKYDLCVKASKSYFQSYNPEMCHKCHNGGLATNIDGSCRCACKSSFYGEYCENQWGKISGEKRVPLDNWVKLTVDPKLQGVSTDPIVLNKVDSQWEFGGILKRKDDKIYHLISDSHKVTWKNKTLAGRYTIQIFDEYLNIISQTNFNFHTFKECTPSTTYSISCRIHDFDINSKSQFVLSVAAHHFQTDITYDMLYIADMTGSALSYIPNLCLQHSADWNLGSKIALVNDDIYVTCPKLSVRVFSEDGNRLKFTQFTIPPNPDSTVGVGELNASASAGELNGIAFLGNTLWLHTQGAYLVGYDVTTWELTWQWNNPYPPPNPPPAGHQATYTQIDMNFLGNLVLGEESTQQAASASQPRDYTQIR